jgi:hypothetical protein
MILKFEGKAMEDVPTGAAKAKATRDRRARTVNCMFAVGSIDLEVERDKGRPATEVYKKIDGRKLNKKLGKRERTFIR